MLDCRLNCVLNRTAFWRATLLTCFAFVFSIALFAMPQNLQAQITAEQKAALLKKQAKKPAFPDWKKVTEGTTKIDGLFPLYFDKKKQKLYMEISKAHFNRELIMPISIARGTGLSYLGGSTLNFGNQWIVTFNRVGNRMLLVRKNVSVRAKKGTPVADSVKVSHTDSVIMALPIRSEQMSGLKVLIDLSDLFMTDLANIGIRPDRKRSTWGKVKAFPRNIEIQVNAVFTSPYRGYEIIGRGGSSSPDARGTQVVLHYGFSVLPSSSYKPRAADDRIGYFQSTVKDFSKDTNDTPTVRYVNRWRLEKTNPKDKLSPPKKPIVFWIEKTVPREYRRYVREGILEWNKAFEKIGFLDAVQCRDQMSLDDFEPEDIRFNTFRWITSSGGFAMGPSRVNPKTGEILDADIVFDESMIRSFRNSYIRRVGIPQALELKLDGQMRAYQKLHSADLPFLVSSPRIEQLYLKERVRFLKENPHAKLSNPVGMHNAQGDAHANCRQCAMGPGMQHQLRMMAAVLAARGVIAPGEKIPQKYLGQAIKEVVMHEVGHTLGLRHNFKASTMLTLDELRNPEITRKKGMVGSVMDYSPAHFARKGQKQGDYFSQTLGPYDYWAIEYAYKPILGSESAELAKIASRAPEKDLTFGTDEDLYSNPDPRINLFDMSDPLNYAEDRILFVKESMKGLENRVVAKGEGFQRSRSAFMTFLGEISRSSTLASQYIGGEYTSRDHRGDLKGHAPMTPIPLAKQQKALKLIGDEILDGKAFQFSPELLKSLAPAHFSDAHAFGGSYHVPVNQIVLRIQSNAINMLLDGNTLKNVQEIQNHAKKDEKTLALTDIFGHLTKSIWSDLDAGAIKKNKNGLELPLMRRNLQREHLAVLSRIALGRSRFAPADAVALSRSHLQRIEKRIGQLLEQADKEKLKTNEMTHVHLSDLRVQINKTLNASIEASSP